MNPFQWDACPLCGGSDLHEIGPIAYRQPIRFSTREIALAHTPMLFECSGCDSWFTQRIVPQATAFLLYETGASSEKWADTPAFVEGKSRNIVDRLSQHIKAGKKVLDVGANTGELLDHVRSLGAETSGAEPSRASREVLTRKGHQTFARLEDVSGTFDVITAFDLVEHLYDIPVFLRRAHQLLAPDGVLILLTGDRHCLSAEKSRQNWWYLKAPEHIVFPSDKYFRKVPGFQLLTKDATYASAGYERSRIMQWLQFIRKILLKGGYDGLPSLGPDHMLLSLKKTDMQGI